MGWPNGPADNAAILALPSDRILMLSTEGRYHHDEAVRAGKQVLWRAIPRIGHRPAELGWSPGRFVDEVLNLTDEAHEPIRAFIPANELDLQDERGDHEDDFTNLDTRYRLIGGFMFSALSMLRQRLPITQLHFPAFTPDHDALLYVDFWRPAAELIDVHAYDTLEKIQTQYAMYRSAFPGRRLALTEWHGLGDAEEEERILGWLAQTMDVDPLLDAAYRYIWQWFNAPGWWSEAYDVVHNPAMLALFRNPPTVEVAPAPEPIPEPEPPPDEESMTRDEIIALIVSKANEHGLVPYEFLGGAIAESNLDPKAWRQGVWPDWSAGLFQQTVAFADEGDHSASEQNVALIKQLYFDPVHACDVAAVKYHYWRYNPDVPAETAWVAYNGPSYYHTPEQSPNLENYRRSLAEAAQILGIVTEQPSGRTYGPDVPSEVVGQRNSWSCAVRSTYAALWAMAQQGHGEPVTYGDEGPRDVYDWLVPRYDDPSVGLHDHTGAGLVQALQAHGYTVSNLYPASLASVQARAGMQPVLLGGDAWNHWVMVRGVESDGTLILENPMPGFAGINDELRDSFGRLGPMAMVWIDVPTEQGGDVTEAEAAALRAENQHLRDMLGYASGDIAAAIQKEIDTIKPSLGALESANNTLKQQTPPAA
jgi:hypothetical protein